MKTARPPKHRQAFTLIELLVVITIIGILASIAFPVVGSVMERARKVRTLAVIKELQVAIKGYQTEYNRYPSETTGSDSNTKTSAGDPLIAILYASESQTKMNGRGIKYLELPMAKNGKGGLVGATADSYSLVDDWGQPYAVVMDTSGDERVDNPDVQNEESKISATAPPQLPMGVVIYSFGPDGAKKQTPSKDDLTSWRG